MEFTIITNLVSYVFTMNLLYGNLSDNVNFHHLGNKYLKEISVGCAAIVNYFDSLADDPDFESINLLQSKIVKLRNQMKPVEEEITLLLKQNETRELLWLRASAYLTLSTINSVERTCADIERELNSFLTGDIDAFQPNTYNLESAIEQIYKLNHQYLVDDQTLQKLLKGIDRWENHRSRESAQHFLKVLEVMLPRQDAFLSDLCTFHKREIDSEHVYLSFEAEYLIRFNFKVAVNSRWLIARYRSQISDYLKFTLKAQPAPLALRQCA